MVSGAAACCYTGDLEMTGDAGIDAGIDAGADAGPTIVYRCVCPLLETYGGPFFIDAGLYPLDGGRAFYCEGTDPQPADGGCEGGAEPECGYCEEE